MLPQLIGAETPEKLSDDRIGRALDRLFDVDRAALLTEFVLGLITEFRIGLKQLHTDATTITLSGLYREADGRAVRGRTTVKAAFGHSKDHRFDLKQLLGGNPPAWQPVVSYTNPVTGAVTDVVQAMDCPLPDPDGYRLIWYHSSAKQDQDAAWRQQQLERAVTELEQLKVKVERSRSLYSTRAGVAEKVEQILAHRGAQRWLRYRIEERRERRFRQEHRGRPGNQTRWRSSVKLRFALSWEPSVKGIEEDALQDGVFPLLTNCRELSMQEVLEAYRCKQPMIEKRHELLKTLLEVRPPLSEEHQSHRGVSVPGVRGHGRSCVDRA
jgi:transposase